MPSDGEANTAEIGLWEPDPDETLTAAGLCEPQETRRCDACWRRAEFLVEIPRQRSRGNTEPARLRLCRSHAGNVLGQDTEAVAFYMRFQETG